MGPPLDCSCMNRSLYQLLSSPLLHLVRWLDWVIWMSWVGWLHNWVHIIWVAHIYMGPLDCSCMNRSLLYQLLSSPLLHSVSSQPAAQGWTPPQGFKKRYFAFESTAKIAFFSTSETQCLQKWSMQKGWRGLWSILWLFVKKKGSCTICKLIHAKIQDIDIYLWQVFCCWNTRVQFLYIQCSEIWKYIGENDSDWVWC